VEDMTSKCEMSYIMINIKPRKINEHDNKKLFDCMRYEFQQGKNVKAHESICSVLDRCSWSFKISHNTCTNIVSTLKSMILMLDLYLESRKLEADDLAKIIE